jgi:ABC-type nickel/cobalt efflux system permease component RcnA
VCREKKVSTIKCAPNWKRLGISGVDNIRTFGSYTPRPKGNTHTHTHSHTHTHTQRVRIANLKSRDLRTAAHLDILNGLLNIIKSITVMVLSIQLRSYYVNSFSLAGPTDFRGSMMTDWLTSLLSLLHVLSPIK